MITQKHLGLTAYLHQSYGSKKLIEDLNSHGYTVPYSEVRHVLHRQLFTQQTASGISDPMILFVDKVVFYHHLSQLMRLWYLSHMPTAKAQARLHSPEPSLFAHMKYGKRRRVRPKIRHLAPLDGCICAFEE